MKNNLPRIRRARPLLVATGMAASIGLGACGGAVIGNPFTPFDSAPGIIDNSFGVRDMAAPADTGVPLDGSPPADAGCNADAGDGGCKDGGK